MHITLSSLPVDCMPRSSAYVAGVWFLRWLPILLIIGVAWTIELVVPPFHRYFSPADPSISYPHQSYDTVPPWALFVISLAVPLVIISSISILLKLGWRDAHEYILGLCAAFAFNALFTHIVKVTVGRHRPDWLDRCHAVTNNPGSTLSYTTVVLLDTSVCQPIVPLPVYYDGMKSFPSGHSSYSFAGLVFLSFYLYTKLRNFPSPYNTTFRPMICILPVIGAMLVAISRVCDYRYIFYLEISTVD